LTKSLILAINKSSPEVPVHLERFCKLKTGRRSLSAEILKFC